MENINIYKYSRLSQSEILNLCKRAESNLFDYFEIVDEIIKNVEENKENALVEYSKKLDNVKSGLREFKVSEEEFSRAHDLIDDFDTDQLGQRQIKACRSAGLPDNVCAHGQI